MSTCKPCHQDQNNAWAPDQERAIAATKAFLCMQCGDNYRALKQRQVDGEGDAGDVGDDAVVMGDAVVMVGNCQCEEKVRKSWLCHTHRAFSIKELNLRAMQVDDWLIRNELPSARVCYWCKFNMSDVNSRAWRCKACRSIVLERLQEAAHAALPIIRAG